MAVLVALISLSLSTPTYSVNAWMEFLFPAIYCILTIRAITHPGRERMVLSCGLVCGLFYLFLEFWSDRYLVTSRYISWTFNQFFVDEPGPNGADDKVFESHAGYAVSFVLTVLGALLAGHWTKQKKK
jgi:hypothetical protein